MPGARSSNSRVGARSTGLPCLVQVKHRPPPTIGLDPWEFMGGSRVPSSIVTAKAPAILAEVVEAGVVYSESADSQRNIS